jgi:glycosyltransferase involved in cell wall biosynthesis
MKVLIYAHSFAPAIGGNETIAMSIARGLAQFPPGDPCKVTLATRTPRGADDDASLSFEVVRQPGFWNLGQLIRRADVIHIAGPALLPMLLARVLRKPWVIVHHGFEVICPNGQMVQKPGETACPGHFMAGNYRECVRCNADGGRLASLRLWALTFIRRWFAKRTRVNILPTAWLGSQLRLPRMQMIHHGLTAGSAPVADPNLDPPTFFFLGRLVSSKGVQTLIEAAAELRSRNVPFRLRIAGDGPQRAAIRHNIDSAGLSDSAELLGGISVAQKTAEFEHATATVMPSIGGEVFGLVALESMARSCPVVTSDIGALVEVVGDAGVSFPTGDGRALAGRLEEFASGHPRAMELRRRCRARAAEMFSEEQMIAEHFQVLRNVVERDSVQNR